MVAPAPSFERAVAANGEHIVRLQGRLDLAAGGELWRQLRKKPAATAGARWVIDLEQVHSLEPGAAALLQELRAQAVADGGDIEFRNVTAPHQHLLELYACPTVTGCLKSAPVRIGMLEQIGRAAALQLRELQSMLGFVGDLLLGMLGALRRPSSVNFRDLGGLMERAGADGVPIICLINFLVGAVLGLQGAIQLHRFGADPFLANLVGLSVVRELGPLMTAILIAGRSGAAYAAELGTMSVSEEVDALRTLGQDPQRFLVFPRVLALVLVTPLLTVLADLVGCIGGLAIAVFFLRQPPIAYLQQLQQALDLNDLLTGLCKSAAFAGLIGLVACQRGLNARGGAASVGSSTTSAVVIVLFGLVVLDSAFTLMFSALGI